MNPHVTSAHSLPVRMKGQMKPIIMSSSLDMEVILSLLAYVMLLFFLVHVYGTCPPPLPLCVCVPPSHQNVNFELHCGFLLRS